MILRLFIVIGSGLIFCGSSVRADESPLPGEGFNASRYEALWTKSPFSVASPETGGTSPDYSLVGLSQFDGISYASLIDKQSQEHFLLTSEKPVRGLTLVSISHGHDTASTSVVVQRGGESLTLKLEEAPMQPQNPNMANGAPGMPLMPGTVPQISLPGAMPPGFNIPGMGQRPPQAMFRHPIIHVPPQPMPQNPQNQTH